MISQDVLNVVVPAAVTGFFTLTPKLVAAYNNRHKTTSVERRTDFDTVNKVQSDIIADLRSELTEERDRAEKRESELEERCAGLEGELNEAKRKVAFMEHLLTHSGFRKGDKGWSHDGGIGG